MSEKKYEIWVKVGEKGGPFEPKDPSRLGTMVGAIQLANEVWRDE